MKHYLINLGTNDAAINAEIDRLNKERGKKIGLHECIVKLISGHISAKVSYMDKREFETNINILKAFRVDSDYKNESVFPDKSEKSIKLSKKINDFLKKHL